MVRTESYHQPLEGLSPRELQLALAAFNGRRLRPALPDEEWREALLDDLRWRLIEGAWIESEREVIAARAAEAPRDPVGFLAWFEALREHGPGQGDPLFPWLATDASADQVRWFLTQEVAGEAGFDDLVALTQLKLPVQAKLELARNYWDEMGNGRAVGMHGPMLGHLAEAMELSPDLSGPDLSGIVWEALAVGNLLAGLAANRRYAFHSLGALGAVELTAPSRAVHVAAALERIGVGPDVRRYFTVHAVLDVKHAEAWNREVIVPLVKSNPEVAVALAEGALMRLRAGARSFARYRRDLGVGTS